MALVAGILAFLLLIPALVTAAVIEQTNTVGQLTYQAAAQAAAKAGLANYMSNVQQNPGFATCTAGSVASGCPANFAPFGGTAGIDTWEPVMGSGSNSVPLECYAYFPTASTSGAYTKINLLVVGRATPTGTTLCNNSSSYGINDIQFYGITANLIEEPVNQLTPDKFVLDQYFSVANPNVYTSGASVADCGYHIWDQNTHYMYTSGTSNTGGTDTTGTGTQYGPAQAFNHPTSAGTAFGSNAAYECNLNGLPFHDGQFSSADQFNGNVYSNDGYYSCSQPGMNPLYTYFTGDPYSSNPTGLGTGAWSHIGSPYYNSPSTFTSTSSASFNHSGFLQPTITLSINSNVEGPCQPSGSTLSKTPTYDPVLPPPPYTVAGSYDAGDYTLRQLYNAASNTNFSGGGCVYSYSSYTAGKLNATGSHFDTSDYSTGSTTAAPSANLVTLTFSAGGITVATTGVPTVTGTGCSTLSAAPKNGVIFVQNADVKVSGIVQGNYKVVAAATAGTGYATGNVDGGGGTNGSTSADTGVLKGANIWIPSNITYSGCASPLTAACTYSLGLVAQDNVVIQYPVKTSLTVDSQTFTDTIGISYTTSELLDNGTAVSRIDADIDAVWGSLMLSDYDYFGNAEHSNALTNYSVDYSGTNDGASGTGDYDDIGGVAIALLTQPCPSGGTCCSHYSGIYCSDGDEGTTYALTLNGPVTQFYYGILTHMGYASGTYTGNGGNEGTGTISYTCSGFGCPSSGSSTNSYYEGFAPFYTCTPGSGNCNGLYPPSTTNNVPSQYEDQFGGGYYSVTYNEDPGLASSAPPYSFKWITTSAVNSSPVCPTGTTTGGAENTQACPA